MVSYGMGFIPAEKPLGKKGKIAEMLDAFTESEDECISATFDYPSEAQTMRAGIGRVIRESEKYAGLACKREGTTVYVYRV